MSAPVLNAAPLPVITGWLKAVARVNPVSEVLDLARQAVGLLAHFRLHLRHEEVAGLALGQVGDALHGGGEQFYGHHRAPQRRQPQAPLPDGANDPNDQPGSSSSSATASIRTVT